MTASFPGSIKSFVSRTDGVDDVMAAHVNDIQDEVAAIETQLLAGYIDYSGISTVVGWGSFTYKQILYKKIGNLCFVQFKIQGVSDSATTTFTLPFNNAVGGTDLNKIMLVSNDGTPAAGSFQLSANSNVATFYRDVAGTGWTASGNKWIMGQFFYMPA